MWSRKKGRTSHAVFVVQQTDRFGDIPSLDTAFVGGAEGDIFHGDGAYQASAFLGKTIPRKRYRLAVLVVAVALLVLTGRASFLQIARGAEYRSLAEGNRFRTYTVLPPRGIVYDRNGVPLIENAPSFQILLVRADAPEGEALEQIFSTLSDLSGVSTEDMWKIWEEAADAPFEPVVLARSLSYDNALRLAIMEHTLPGVRLESAGQRSYQTASQSLSHVLGYVGGISPEELEVYKEQGYRRTDSLGKAGIEKSEEAALRGVPGSLVVEVDALGNELGVISKEDPIPATNLTLSIDAHFQAYLESRLQDMFEHTHTSRGSIVAIDPQNGEVRALVSLPAYDSNRFSNHIDGAYYDELLADKDLPLFPRATSGEFPSGSTFKPFVAYAALTEHVVEEDTTVVSTGGLRVGAWFFPDWKAGGHGSINVRSAIAWSVNTFFYIVGGGYESITGLGPDRITEYAARFGFGQKTGINLPTEADGFLPTAAWKQEKKGEPWYVGDSYHYAIGQGDLLVTPLQLARGIATIANGGRMVTPTLLETDRQVTDFPEIPNLDAHALRVVQEGMRQTVTEGSGRLLNALSWATAGKTGTAQAPGGQNNHAWYAGYGPFDDPSLAIVVLVEEGLEGSSAAAPIARDAFAWWSLYGEKRQQ